MKTGIFAILLLCLTATTPVYAGEDLAPPKVDLPRALELCQKWFAEHRMLSSHFIIASAVLKPDADKAELWEIRFRHRRATAGKKEKRVMILTVKMDSTVKRTQKE